MYQQKREVAEQLVPAVEYLQAQRIRYLLIQEMNKVMQTVDVYVAPWDVGQNLLMNNLTGHPAVGLPNGFTTAPSDARSTIYCTDVAKMIQAPIFHVNGEDPEAAVYVAELAFDFRQTFHRDVVIDMFCYRRHGHNEGDEPAFTQPLMYAKIRERPTQSEVYTEQLVLSGDLTVACSARRTT